MTLIPISVVMILFNTGSFWTSIIAYFTFGEPIYAIEIIAMIISFASLVTMTLKGASSELETTTKTEAVADESSNSKAYLGYIIIFINSWIYASNCVLNRALKGVHHAIVMFWHGFIGFTIAVIAVLIEAWASTEES